MKDAADAALLASISTDRELLEVVASIVVMAKGRENRPAKAQADREVGK